MHCSNGLAAGILVVAVLTYSFHCFGFACPGDTALSHPTLNFDTFHLVMVISERVLLTVRSFGAECLAI